MGRTPDSVRFDRAGDGHISVSAPRDLQPIEDFLESDIGDNVPELELVIEHARNPGPSSWGFGGDSCHVSIGPDDVRDLYAHCRERAVISDPLELRPWGLSDFRLADPDGYYLRITHGNAAAQTD